MRHRSLLLGVLLLGASLVGGVQLLHGQAVGGKTVKLKLLLPPSPAGGFYVATKVFVNGTEIPGEGDERNVTATAPKGSDFVTVKAVWHTNNYTEFHRSRKVPAKEGEIVVDLRKDSATEKDDIKVRFVPTPDDVVEAMCRLAKVGKDDVVYDLGCGDGRMVITAVKKFGAKKGVGVDIDEKLVKECKEAAKQAGVDDKVQFRVGDVLKVEDMSDATVVLLYMGDDINKRLKPILQKTLKPGSRVVSHRFLMGDDWRPDHSEAVQSTAGVIDIHLWDIKKK
jgi:tRNA A58 N-methylase Trm61